MNEQLISYARGLNADEKVIGWLEGRYAKDAQKGGALTTEAAEHVIDFFISGDAPARFENMSAKEASAAAEKWTATLRKKGEHIKETAVDTEVVLDFKDGFRVVKLVGKAAYEREGYLMRHCVASYYGNGKEVYSLRDKQNMPHCTIEKDQQIKGKGNGDIHPKYIDYVVRFLEHTGMAVRDSEMAHLGYEVVLFGKYAKTPLYRDRYAVKGTQIVYHEDLKIFDSQTELQNYLGKGVVVFKGNIEVKAKQKLSLGKLTEVSGYVDVQEGATFTAPLIGYPDKSPKKI